MRRLLLLAFIWGWSFLFIKVSVEGMTPTTVAWGRITLGGLVLVAVVGYQRLRIPFDRLMLRHYAVMAVGGSILPFTLLAWGEQRIASALTAVLNASTPLFTALFAALAGQERLRRLQCGGLAVGVLGVAVAAGLGGSDLRGSSIAGSLAAIAAAACYGITMPYARQHFADIPPMIAATGQLLVGSLVLAPIALGTTVTSGFSLSPTRLAAIVLLGAVCTGCAYILHYRNIAEMGATQASLVTYLIPVVAVIVGVVVLDEPLTWRLPVGGVLTIVGIAAVTSRRGTPDRAVAPTPEPV